MYALLRNEVRLVQAIGVQHACDFDRVSVSVSVVSVWSSQQERKSHVEQKTNSLPA